MGHLPMYRNDQGRHGPYWFTVRVWIKEGWNSNTLMTNGTYDWAIHIGLVTGFIFEYMANDRLGYSIIDIDND
jgi:hypothetical protein